MQVKLEPPASRVLRSGIIPIVHEVARRCAVEALKRETFGVEGLLL
jgi:hypothetical protein